MTHKETILQFARALLLCAFLLIGLSGCEMIADASSPTASLTPEAEVPVVIQTVVATVTPAPDLTVDVTATLLPTPTTTFTPTPTPSRMVCPELSGHYEQYTFESEAMGEQVRYLVYVPPCYDTLPDRAYPTLYLFHGWPLDEHHWQDLGIGLWIDDWVSRSLMGPMLVVLPGVDQNGLFVNSSGGPYSFEGMITDELVPRIDAAYRTWREPEGRAVGGISRGAVWALEIALRHQDIFGAVGAHSPALALNNPLPQYDPYLLIQQETPTLRFYLSGGDVDWARAGAIKFRDALEALDIPVTYQVHEGNHVDELWSRGLPDYLAWYSEPWPLIYEDLPVWQGSPTVNVGTEP